ncbi:SNF2-related protein [Helicobacter pylori]|uniref:Eco57I restriction-modification methylase family protein n=1 Tax=Helicobacter pylori Hp P-4 TaxID=992075 RepID=J0PRU2_HELPX|nr:SNF2-related protein [Helicobacter pylori]EJC01393.1 eco57I restriction-modification methylase family protein [Helicobacter pylori Hp P-4]EJC22226.1 eco57I restriction-modification methylase family protein [Helicobacter pylori Hp P-4d]EJC23229.1 eco57I restriction-modification methylase family protein [Helicobacter pylori Hp P-4c]
MQKKKVKNPQPNLFSILDNGNIATNNPTKESDKVNEKQDPLPYVVKTQVNKASMISRNPIEWAKYLSFERRLYKDNSKEYVNFFANGEIKESSRVYEANEEGFERRITKRYDLIDTIRNREFFSKEINILTYTNSLKELKEQGLEIQLTHHNETHKKTLENGNEIAKEYDYLKDIYQEVERTKDGELVREIIPSISSAEYFKLYNKPPFESTNNENTKLNTNGNEEVKKLEFELAKEVHTLILEQELLSATNYYSWIDKDDYANFAWKMHRLINENKLKENHLSADNANKIKQFFFNNGFILGWTKEEQSAIQENRDYSLRSALLSLEEIAQAKIELQKYYESVYLNGDGNKREIKPFKEILRDINNFEKAYKERYNKLASLNEAIIQAKESSNERQNSNANNNNTINNTIDTNTSIGNNIIQNNDNNHPNLSLADLELEQQNLGEPNGKERTNRADEPSRARAGIPQEIHRRSEHGRQQEGVERSSDEDLSHQDSSLFIEPGEQGGTRGVYRSSDQQAVSEESHRERDRIHEHVSRGDGVSARADARANSNGASSPASRMENGTRSEEKGDNPSDERGVSQTPQSPSHQQNSSRDLGLSLSREQPGQTGRLRLFDHGQMGSLFPTDHENQRERNDNELDKSSDRANENGDKSPRQNGSANQESARSERYGIAQGSSNQSVLPLAQSRLHHAGLSTPNGLGNLEENRDQKRGLLSNLDNLESLLNAIRNNTIASEPDFRSRLLEAIQNNEPLKDSLVGAQLLKDPTIKIFYDKFQLKISPKKVLEILENRIKKSIETANETLNAFNTLDSQAIDGNAISNSVGLSPTQESKTTDNSVELNNAQEQTAQERDTQENVQTTLKQETLKQETQEQETPTTPVIPINPKIDFKPSEEVLIKGAKTRYKANIKAIELLKELQAKQEILKGDYYATLEEQEILAQFSGWGGLESYFKKAQHPDEFKELNALLTKDEFRRAYSSTRDAYYTPKLVIDSIYQALDQLGFNNDNHQKEIFEPSLGTGKFIAHAPSDKNYRFIGTELDPISASISQFLYPNQVIHNTALENHQFYQEYDAFVGNPPYGNHKIYSSNDKELSNESVHNYFLGKAIKELKDDGIGAFVVSSWFMDGKNPKMREHIAQNATFLGAIRLPNSVFKATGAEVSSDIVFFKKGVDEATNQSFTKAMPYYDKIIDSLDDDTLFALQNNRFDSFTPSDQLKIVIAVASHFGFKQEKLQRWYEKIDTANFGYKEQDYKIIKDFIDKVGKNNINLNEQTLNEYFTHHPENILGHLSLEKTRYSFETNGEQIYKYELQALEDKSLDLSQALNQAIEKLPKGVYQYHKTTLKTDALIIDANNERYQEVQKLIKNLERGELVKWDNLYFQLEQNNERGIFLKPTKINSKVQDSRLKAYFKIKDALNDLTSTELNPLSSDLELESKRVRLNLVYDEFVKKFGYLNENKNRKDIKQDLYGAKVLGLEKDFEKEITPRSAKMQNIEPRQAQAKKAQIFFERTLNPKKELIITNAKEALIASVNQKGCLDLHFIRDHFTTQSLETTIKELLEQKLIYKDHKDNGDYVLANDYLSGNVKRKLKEVKEAINQGVEGLEVNVKDLELIIPKDLKATEIMANINSPWIPTQYLEEFLIELSANHYEKQYGDKMTDYQLDNLKEDIKVEHLNGAYEVFVRNNELNELYGIRHKDKAHSYKVPFESLLNKVLNNKDLSVKYAQVDPNDPKKEIFITDEEQSNLARQKAEELKEAFKDWIYKDYARRTHLEQIYNDTFNNSVLKTYDGSQLELEGFNQYISLRPHQKNAIFRTIQDRAVCLDHQVGAGKTLCAIASCMEQKRMGLVNKTLIAVPNHLTKQWGDEFYKAYPNANVLVVDSKDITEKERELLFNQIANNNYDAVIIAHTHLELLSNPRGIIEGLKEEELVNAEKNFERQELAYKNNPRETKKPNERAFKNKLDKIRAKYDAILEKQGSHIDISQMGIDNLIVDEAHLFKNLAFETSMEKIAGLGNQQGSNRARDLFIKTRYLHQNDKKIMFLTGTPIANSLSEMYHLQRYLTPDVLKERGLEFFDDWAKTYGEVVNDFELDTSAQSYKMVNRFSKFSDVQGLSTMYRAFADIVSNDDILKHNPHFVPKVYGDKPINVVVKRSEEVAQFIGMADENGKYNEGSIIDRMQKCEGKKSKKGQDNILSCTTDARKVALDYRLIDPNAKVEKEFSKSYAMAKNIYENYLETNATKGTQLGFIGLSTPKTHSQKVSLEALDNTHEIENKNPLDEAQELLESLSSYDENGNLIAPSKKELENEFKEKEAKSVNLDEELAKGSKFDVYSDVLRHLVQMGIPQNEIAFIHDAKTEEQKQDLFKRVNRGEVRVLLGSPAKMGVGTNVQERLVAMHELDCPWRPDELLQMEGRGIRQGNILHQNDPENFRMKIYRYATEKTYDSRMWQIIETKSKGIEQFRNAHKLGLNELEDFNMGSSNASEMKAEATGNPLIIEEVKLRAEIKSEEAKYKAFNKEHYFNEENLKNNASKLDYLKQELKDLETLQRSVIIPTHTEIKLYDLKNEESKDYELIKVKEVEPLKENASMSEELTHKKLKEQNKQIAEQNKEKLDAIKKQFASNLNTLFLNEEEDYKLLEYKGFVVNAYKTKYQVEFSLSPKDNPNIAYSPSNMVYKNDTGNMFSSYNFCSEIKFDGFLKRLDNAITKLPEKIKELENSIETTKENIAKYTRLVEQKLPYPRLEYLQALKLDHKTLIDDLAKMGKDRDYKPAFNPKPKEVLEKMNAEKRASLENEREEVKEQANQEAYSPMKKAVNDDYDMGM